MGTINICMIIAIASIWFAICSVVGFLAETRGRSFGGWTMFAFFFSPILGMILVLAFGETEEHWEERVEKEEEIRIKIRERHDEREGRRSL